MSWGIVAGAAITAIGGAMGSKGQGGSSSTQQVMDPRMAPYIFGQNGQPGLLSMTQDQLQRSQSPQRMQGWDNMMNRGQGLLNGSVAGNPFSGAYSGGSLHGLYQGLLQNSQGRYTPPPLPAPPPAPAPAPQMTPTIEQLIAQFGGGGGMNNNGNQGSY